MDTSKPGSNHETGHVFYGRGRSRYLFGNRIRAFFAYLVLLFFVVFAVGPVLYLISPALRDSISLFDYPPKLIPDDPTLDNFRFLFDSTRYLSWALNTIIFAAGTTIISLFTNV